MNPFLFTQFTNTILGILIVGILVSMINKKFRIAGGISIVLSILILLIGIISPISIVLCAIVALIMGTLGLVVIRKDKKDKETVIR